MVAQLGEGCERERNVLVACRPRLEGGVAGDDGGELRRALDEASPADLADQLAVAREIADAAGQLLAELCDRVDHRRNRPNQPRFRRLVIRSEPKTISTSSSSAARSRIISTPAEKVMQRSVWKPANSERQSPRRCP